MTVFVRSLEFYAYHGVPAEERAVGHRYTADLEFEVCDAAGDSDEVSESVDYGLVAVRLQALAQDAQVRTLERLVTLCGYRLLEEFPLIESLNLSIAKRMPPAPIVAQEVGVRRTFRRTI